MCHHFFLERILKTSKTIKIQMYESKNSFFLFIATSIFVACNQGSQKRTMNSLKVKLHKIQILNFKFIIFMQHTVAQLVIALKLISNKFWRVILKTKLNKVL